MREAMLRTLARWHTAHPWRMLVVVGLLTVAFGVAAGQLELTMRWSDLLPEGDRRTVQFNRVIDEFVSATSLVVVVQGKEERIKAFADVLAPRILEARDTSTDAVLQKEIEALRERINRLRTEGQDAEIAELSATVRALEAQIGKKLFQRVDYRAEVDFLRNHGLMLIKEEDLRSIKDLFTDPNLSGLLVNLNDSMEKEYVGQEESISTREKEDRAVVFLDGIQSLVLLLQRAARQEAVSEEDIRGVVDKLLLGEPYLLSYDKEALILNAIPTFTMMDADLLVIGTDTVQAIVEDVLEDFPDVQAGLTGMIAVGRDEMVYSTQSLGYTTVIAVVAILVLLMISFRMWVAPVLAIANLLVGLVWAVGMATLVVGQLNIMTQMMSVILMGLGIDFSIHLISAFTERRAAGESLSDALENTFVKSGRGVVTGALTTACAFLTLLISRSRGMKEMGLVTGAGLLAILIATLLFLPILLVWRERRMDRRRAKTDKTRPVVRQDISFPLLGRMAQRLGTHYGFTLLGALILSVALTWSAFQISFDHNYMNIEPKGLTSIALQDTILEKFDLSMDYALILADDVSESRRLSRMYRDMGSVAITEDISVYLPSSEEQARRTPHIAEILQEVQSASIRSHVGVDELPALRAEVERLEMNVMEMQDLAFLGGQDKVDARCTAMVGDPERPGSRSLFRELLEVLDAHGSRAVRGWSAVQQVFAPYFKASVLRMCSIAPIRQEDLPASILDRYSNRTRDQFLVTVFPAGNIWQDAAFLHRFVDDVERVSDKATGMPPVFRALIEVIGRDGRYAVLLTLVLIFLLLWADFRHPGHALMAMVPLALGVFWMVGLMHLTGMSLTVMNVMGLPMILGIGIDDGVHIIHRWRQEGKGTLRLVFSSTGKAILLTSLTTMLAFGSLVFSIWRGFAQLGGALFLGVGACFVATIVVLPGMIGRIEHRRGAG